MFEAFLDNLLNPFGNLKDYQHAARLYADNQFRLAPKTAYLYHVNFKLTDDARQTMINFNNQLNNEINMLVKEIDLPGFQSTTIVKNQYNRKKNVQTRVDYDPVKIALHDDNIGLTTLLMEAYYKYYFADGRSGIQTPRLFDPRNAYKGETSASYAYGMDDGPNKPFFESINIYQLSRKSSTLFQLVNPLIQSWNHDNLNQADGNRMTENSLTVAYESVIYERDTASGVPGFAEDHYDKAPSPLSIGGGGTESFFGTGGILDGIGTVAGDVATGEAGLGTIITGANTIRNLGNLDAGDLLNEGGRLLSNAIRSGSVLGSGSNGQRVSGIPNTIFPNSLNSNASLGSRIVAQLNNNTG